MMSDDKSDFLRARVSKETKAAFEKYATALGKTPTDQLREMVDQFIRDEAVRTQQDVVISISRPPGYDFGAWLVTIKVQDPNAVAWQGRPFGFQLPELPKRRIQSDPAYLAPILVAGGEIKLGGHFVDGLWRGHLYTNGIEESINPTPLEVVHDQLEKTTRELIASLSSRWRPT